MIVEPGIIQHLVPWSHTRRRPVEGAIIHAMGELVIVPEKGTYPAAEFLERSPELVGSSYSAHRLVAPNGDIIVCVPDDRLAFHARDSRLGELVGLNKSFLGLEWPLPGKWIYGDFVVEMGRGNVGYTDEQYEAGGELYAQWMREHGFDRSRIVTHAQVAGDDVRGEGNGKTDPGIGFNQGMLTNAIVRAQKAQE